MVIPIEARIRASGRPGPLVELGALARGRAEAEDILGRLGFPASGGRTRRISLHGDRKRLEFCVALATRPGILMLDEPTAGMSPSDRREMTRFLARFKAETGITIVMTEHDMDLIFELADRLMVLNYGEVIAVGDRPRCATIRWCARSISARAASMLEIRSLDAYYGRAHILHQIGFAMAEGGASPCSAATAPARARCSRAS